MNLFIFIPLLIAFQVIDWYIGKRASKEVQGREDYFLAKRNIPFFPLMLSFVAAQVGGGLILGAADAAFEYGWSVLLYPLGASLGLICLGLGLGRRLASFQVSTISQILEVVYRSSALKKLCSILSSVSLFMVLVAQFIASHKFLIAIGLSNSIFFLALWGFIILYTMRGGLRSVISTQVFQVGIFFAALLTALSFVLFGPASLSISAALSTSVISSSKLAGWLVMPLLYILVEQGMGQRCFAGRSPKTVSKAAFWAGICTMIISSIPVALGIMAKKLGLVIPNGASILIIAVSYLTNPWVAAFVGCAILAAIISTATALINAISTNISEDFELFRKKKDLLSTRIFALAIPLMGLLLSLCFNDVIGVLIQSYALFVSTLFAPIFIALFKEKGNLSSALLSIGSGAFGLVLFHFIPLPFPAEIASVLLSFGGYGLGELIFRFRTRKKKLFSLD